VISGLTCVLDASALLTYLGGERGADEIRTRIMAGAAISAVNWAEVLSKLAERGEDPDLAAQELKRAGFLGSVLLVLPVDEALALQIARLRLPTKAVGLSLGDRACLGLGILLDLPVVTTDAAWKKVKLPIEVHAIR